jgi:type I pantothenate kinase
VGGENEAGPWPQTFGPQDWAGWARSGSAGGEPSGIDALATLLSLHWDHRDRLRRAEAELWGRRLPASVLLVGLAGPVASGKSALAGALAERLRSSPFGLDTAVVSTDGFLRPNAELEADGLGLRKGFPESYDLNRLRQLHWSVRVGDDRLTVPVYSHEIYDVAAAPRELDRPQVLVLEGINALQGAPDGGPGPGELADVRLYLAVDEETARGWFTERFLALTAEARTDPDSFYRTWSGLPDAEVRRAARAVWDAINVVNLRDHIEPSRVRADIEVEKASSHAVASLRVRTG